MLSIDAFKDDLDDIKDEFKDELREAVFKKNMNRLGDFEDNNFYLVATLCDPR